MAAARHASAATAARPAGHHRRRSTAHSIGTASAPIASAAVTDMAAPPSGASPIATKNECASGQRIRMAGTASSITAAVLPAPGGASGWRDEAAIEASRLPMSGQATT